MGFIAGPPVCLSCDDEYEPHDHPDYQGFCSYGCYEYDCD